MPAPRGREYIDEQQADQLLPGGCGPILRDFRDERIRGREYNTQRAYDDLKHVQQAVLEREADAKPEVRDYRELVGAW